LLFLTRQLPEAQSEQQGQQEQAHQCQLPVEAVPAQGLAHAGRCLPRQSLHAGSLGVEWQPLTAREQSMLKVIIFVLLLAMIASLTTGAVFFFKDQGRSKRTLYALGVRVTLAILLLITISWGLYTGQLTLRAPWHPAPGTTASQG